jgi:glycosyltransferase involved in cell wall biosynthesis
MTQRKRILLVEGSGRGFLCHYAHALGLGLAGMHHDVLLMTGGRDELAHWTVPFAKQSCMPDGLLSWRCLVRAVREFRPDVVHFQWIGQPLAATAFAAWARGHGISTVYTPHNVLPHRGRWLLTPAYRLFYGSVDAVVARDANIAWGLEEILGVGKDRIVHLPGSPNLMALPGVPGAWAPELPAKLPNETWLLYFGHGSGRKGLPLLLQSLLSDRPANTRLIIAGEGVLSGVDPAALAAVQDAMPVTLIDRYIQPSEVADLFRAADLLVMPYVKQCRSPLLDLAQAFHLPVLRSDRVEAGRFIDGIHGFTVPAQDVAGLTAGLRAALRGDGLGAAREALRREESAVAAIKRLAAGHHQMYAALTEPPYAVRPALERLAETSHA